MKNYAIILASGLGSRLGSELPKQFIQINGKTILEHTIDVFETSSEIDGIILVITPDYRNFTEKILHKCNYKKILKLLNGGKTRKESSYIAVTSINDIEANIIIHDCARPFVTHKIISNCISALKNHKAAAVAVKVIDTVFEVNENNILTAIPDRNYLRNAQTPQCFKLSLIKKAHELAKNDRNCTDDCSLIIKHNLSDIFIIEGSYENIKITYPLDIFLAEKLFSTSTHKK